MTEKHQRIYDYFILSARVLIGWTLISYGWAKLTGNQFGITAQEMAMSVKDISLFKLSWYFFDHEPFKSFIGVSQIIAGLLMLYNRTAILGVLISLPIFANILVIDITYVKMPAFYWRLSWYLLLDFLILWHYKERMFAAFRSIYAGLTTKYKYPLWAYLMLPIMAIVVEILGAVPQFLANLIFRFTETINGIKQLFN